MSQSNKRGRLCFCEQDLCNEAAEQEITSKYAVAAAAALAIHMGGGRSIRDTWS
jgi:hypothetical protein